MSPVLAAVWHSYQQYILAHPHFCDKIYVACSGGRDSMALLVACHQLGLPVHAIHVNHRLQAVSDGWQQGVVDFCKAYQIPIDSVRIDWAAAPARVNEQDARSARYRAILQVAGRHGIIALAHHANDQAETLLMNLCQGTGLAGMMGMAALSEQLEFGEPMWLWRPLLTVPQASITEFVTMEGICYVDDPTNFGEDNQRAFLRNQILPLLAQRFPKLIDNLCRSQTNLREAKTIVDAQSEADLVSCQLSQGWTRHQQRLNVCKLQALPAARRFSLLHRWVKGDEKFAPNRQMMQKIEQLLDLAKPDQQAILQWQGIEIRKYRGTLYRLAPCYAKAIQQSALGGKPLHCLVEVDAPFGIEPVAPNQSFQLLSQPFHQSFKKICQRFEVPSWERGFARVVTCQKLPVSGAADYTDRADMPHLPTMLPCRSLVALLLPTVSVWLVDAKACGLPIQAPCPWRLLDKLS